MVSGLNLPTNAQSEEHNRWREQRTRFCCRGARVTLGDMEEGEGLCWVSRCQPIQLFQVEPEWLHIIMCNIIAASI